MTQREQRNAPNSHPRRTSAGASCTESTSAETPHDESISIESMAIDSPTADAPASRGGLALCCGLVSLAFIVSGIAAAAGGWRPSWDTAFIQLRVFDVGTSRTPLLGMPSTVSQSLAAPAHHPGPLHFWLLAVPTVLTRSMPAGLAIAQAVVNAALASLSLLAIRTVSAARVLWSTTAVWLIAALLVGDELLHDPWNPHMATVALLAAFISATAVWRGDSTIAIISLVVSASVAAQAHLSTLLPAAALVLAATITLLRRRGWRSSVRQLTVGSAVLAACWIGPVVDQLLHRPGNLRTLLTAGGSVGTSFGVVGGFDRVARTVTPPGLIRVGLPAVMAGAGVWTGRIVLLALIAVVLITTVRQWRRVNRSMIGPPALVLVGATWLSQAITPITFGSVFGRHMWEMMWPAALALYAAALAGAMAEMRALAGAQARTGSAGGTTPLQRRVWPALLVSLTVLLVIRPMVTDLESQRDGGWFAAIAAVADAAPHDRADLTIATNGIAIESELVAGVAVELARRGTMVRFTGPVSPGLLHDRRLVSADDNHTMLLFSTVPDDPRAQGSLPIAVIESPVPTEIPGTISLFLIEPTR